MSWWPGDGNASDIMDGNHGTLSGDATFTTGGKVVQAFSFDGVSSTHVTINDADNLRFAGSFTFDAWVNTTSIGTQSGSVFAADVLRKRHRDDGGLMDIGIGMIDNVARFFLTDDTGNSDTATGIQGTTIINDGRWYHIAGVRDSSAGEARLFVDGVLEASLADTTGTFLEVNSVPWNIGNTPGNGTIKFPWNGLIDEVEIFDRALTDAEIKAIFEAGSSGKGKPSGIATPAGMVSWWPGDGNASDIMDGNHGALTGDATFAPGMVGQSFSFDGEEDVVEIADSSGLVPGPAGLTIEAWVNPNTGDKIFSDHFGCVNWESTHLTTSRFIINSSNSPSTRQSLTFAPLPLGLWSHIAAVWDGSEMLVYANGEVVATASAPSPPWDPSAPFVIGGVKTTHDCQGVGTGFFNGETAGLVDELGYYNRALNAAEIRAIFEAGSAGKRKPAGIAPPAGMVSWWPGDGNASDIVDGNTGTIVGGATFTNGLVGQAFSFDAGLSSGITVPNSANLNPTGAITIDAWVKPFSFPNAFPTVVRKRIIDPQYLISVTDQGEGHCNIGGAWADPVGGVVPLNEWTHLACTYDRVAVRLYVNGVEVAISPATQAIPVSSDVLGIGKLDGSTSRNFDGLIDEVEIFNRALSAAEIKAIFEAGSAGKRKS